MSQDQIISLDCKKHVKIFKLSQLGLEKKEIAKLLSTNYGHVYNVLKDYSNSQIKVDSANNIH